MLVPEMVAGDAATVNQAIARAEELARDGFRVLAVAAADQPGPPPAAEMERGLRLLGLIAISPRDQRRVRPARVRLGSYASGGSRVPRGSR